MIGDRRQFQTHACRAAAVVFALLWLGGCAPRPVERPREGAPPIVASAPVRLENAAPPTLAPAGSLIQPSVAPLLAPPPSPSPVGPAAAKPVASPGQAPIIGGLQPAPGAALPPGDVVIGARVTGANDLVEVQAFVDGEPIPVDVGGSNVRVKIVSFVRSFAGGTHEVRIQARDEAGQLGGYRWQFSVGGTPMTAQPTGPVAPAAAPVATKPSAPTPRPAGPPAPAPTATRPPAPAVPATPTRRPATAVPPAATRPAGAPAR